MTVDTRERAIAGPTRESKASPGAVRRGESVRHRPSRPYSRASGAIQEDHRCRSAGVPTNPMASTVATPKNRFFGTPHRITGTRTPVIHRWEAPSRVRAADATTDSSRSNRLHSRHSKDFVSIVRNSDKSIRFQQYLPVVRLNFV
jgi:hypothetical protein